MPDLVTPTPTPNRTAAPVAMRPWVAAGGALAVVSALLAGAWSGATAATAVLDPGVLARYGLPTAVVVAELAASVAIGGLVLAAVVLPRGAAARSVVVVASGAAGVWAVAALARLVLTYSQVAGTPPSSPGFGAELGLFVTAVSLGRTLLGVVVVAAVTCVVAQLVTGPRAALVVAVLASVALAFQAVTGHTTGSTNHELGVAAMFLHLAGAAVWVGGLAAMALVAHRTGRDLAPSVARYSVIAGWCFVAVAISGTVNGALRTGGLEDLTSRYGVLLVVKVLLFGLLGGIGWLHRRAVVGRLAAEAAGTRAAEAAGSPGAEDAPGRDRRRVPGVFWRLVAVELAVMGTVSGVAVALGATAPPVPQEATGELTPAEIVTGHPLPPAPTLELWLTSFRWELLTALGCLAAAVVYLRWVLRLRARGDHWPPSRTVSLLTGLVVLLWATSGGAAVYGHVLFSAHMVQHMTLVMVVPIFLALSAPVTLAARALPRRHDGSLGPREVLLGVVHSRWASFFANPVVAAVNFAGSMIVFYYSRLFEWALTLQVGHLLMIAHFTLVGYLFANALVGIDPGPKRPGYPVRLLILFATMAFHAFFGVALVSDETLLVPEWFGLLGRDWGPSAIADQQTGGAVAWGISELPMLVLAIVLAVSWTRDDERTARRRDRAADRDGDAELTEYNAMLTRLQDRDAR